ncbi:MAG: nuclear transport factor 2 family protein [Chitinophagaceae bacterium]|nr:nuclear transport factor 2 family protein [Chitinophagaceae bacterium]MCW5914528.1 nuclear transport factor 2 family protein [Chitinophagaceae bacterium]MCZ2395369.1 nuclear transport factor 2 family protein [Chitinophagales bacterium]
MEDPHSNIEIVKSLYKAFEAKEIDKVLELLHENVEWGEPDNPYNPAGGTRHGHKGFLEWITIGKKNEEILELHLVRFLTDNNAVAVNGHIKCKAISTQKIYESDFVHIVEIENKKIKKFQEYFDTYIAGEAFR